MTCSQVVRGMRIWMQATVLAFLLLCGIPNLSSQAQQGILEGEVRDAATEEALSQANVVILETNQGEPTDSLGRYRFSSIPVGTHTLRVTYVGYEPYEEEITIDTGETTHVDVLLVPVGLDAGELVIEGMRATDVRDLGTTRISGAELTELPTVLEPDLFRTLQLLPGIQASSDFSSGLYIRGGTPDQTLILVDGAPVYNPTHVFGFFSTFNPDVIEDAQVYKGGYPATYGGRLGSVVDITTSVGNREEVRGTASLGLLASRVSFQGPIENGSWLLAARRSTLEPLFAILNAADVEGIPRGFYFYDVNSRLRLNPTNRDRMSVSLYAGQDAMDYRFLDDAQFDISYGNLAFSMEWRRLLSDTMFSTIRTTASKYASNPTATFLGTDFEQNNTVWDYGVKAGVTADVAERHVIEAGLEIGSFSFDLTNSFDGNVRFEPDVRSGYAQLYFQDTFEPNASWRIRGGVRASYFNAGAFTRVNPRITVERVWEDNTRLQLGYGRYSQFLTLVSSELFSAFDIWLTTGEGVEPSYGDQLIIGLKTNLPLDVELDIEAYARTMHKLFEVDPLLPDVVGLEYNEVFHIGDGYAYGGELFLRRQQGRWSGFLSYTLSWTWRRFEVFEGGHYYPPKFDRRHDVNITGQYALGENWMATGVFSLASGQAYTEPYASYTIHTPFSSEAQNVLMSDFNAARLPAYHRLDLGVQRDGRLLGLADYELQFQIINVYSQRNVWFYLFDLDEEGQLDRTEVPQIPIPLPNISFTLHF